MKNYVVPQKNGKMHREKLKPKICSFPGCKKTFFGTAKSKYCYEHRKKKYRKQIDAKKVAAKKEAENTNNTNFVFNHMFTSAHDIIRECDLECCYNKYKIRVFPRLFVYPKYCPDHRNSWKRELFIKSNKPE